MRMNVVCAADGNYLRHCAAMLNSLVMYGETSNDLHVYLLIDNVDTKTFATAIPYLYSIVPSLSILKASAAPVQDFPVNGHASVATYFRLLLPQLLPAEVKRVIFIDSDAIINSSLLPLWHLDLEGYKLAAVPDHRLSCKDHGYIYGQYFNAGVMLIDLELWRQVDVLGLGSVFASANPHRLPHWDQDVLNHVFQGNWLTIGERWNACPHLFGLLPQYSLHPDELTSSEQEAINNPAIIHFAGSGPVKPWNAHCSHPMRNLYRQAMAATPWASTPLDDLPPPDWKQAWQKGIFRSKCLLKSMLISN